MDSTLAPLLSFGVVIVLIPLALWLLKRTPLGGAAQGRRLHATGRPQPRVRASLPTDSPRSLETTAQLISSAAWPACR